MWLKEPSCEAAGQWKRLRSFFISSRKFLMCSSAACRASIVRRLSACDCSSVWRLSGRSLLDALLFSMLINRSRGPWFRYPFFVAYPTLKMFGRGALAFIPAAVPVRSRAAPPTRSRKPRRGSSAHGWLSHRAASLRTSRSGAIRNDGPRSSIAFATAASRSRSDEPPPFSSIEAQPLRQCSRSVLSLMFRGGGRGGEIRQSKGAGCRSSLG